jgi:hypothetical protein
METDWRGEVEGVYKEGEIRWVGDIIYRHFETLLAPPKESKL